MGKLIDSDWLRAQWDEPTDWMDGDQILHHYTWYKTMIDVAPTVDAVEVVRCKDCKHNPKLEWFGCPMASLSEKQRPETAWCWKGERKDGDNG